MRNLMQIVIFLSNTTEFNGLTKCWAFKVDGPKVANKSNVLHRLTRNPQEAIK
jgi:hypothetical protein